MLYLKSLSMDKFKSFKHAEVLISKGFTCVVGPNGSGKSNIGDALLFGLGESSFRRLRADNLDELINFGVKRKPDEVAKAHVRLEFGGDESLTVERTVRSDGKTIFALNGKHTTRGEVVEVLARHGIRADETNTILQGEISKVADLKPKERRELLDIAAGISDFEKKKAEALRELDTVGQRINETRIMLGERVGFLKELEKEKEAAESYITMTGRLKALKFSVLSAKKKELEKMRDDFTREMALVDSKKGRLAGEIDAINGKIAALTKEKQALADKLSGRSAEAGEITGRLELLNKEIVTLDAEGGAKKDAIQEIVKSMADAASELKRIGETIAANDSAMELMKKSLSEMEALAGEQAAVQDDGSEREIDALNIKIPRLENSFAELQARLSGLNANISSINAGRESCQNEMERDSSSVMQITNAIQKLKNELEGLREEKKEYANGIKLDESEVRKLQGILGDVDRKLLSLKEQRAVAEAREGNLAGRISAEFTQADGFYGKAGQLCSYETKFAAAVEAAAGNRLDYFVVDRIETADAIIKYLKKNELGRATFIPINEVNVSEETKREQGISPVIDVVAYDKKFRRVFQYIFNNSYIIGEIGQAKQYGIGKHRYATLAGDLVEQSGIVSGGSVKKRISLSSLENQIREMEKEKEKLGYESFGINDKLQGDRRELAEVELRLNSYERDVRAYESQATSISTSVKETEGKLAGFDEKAGSARREYEEGGIELKRMEKELNDSKERLRQLYSKAIESSKELQKHGMAKAEKERVEKAREEIQALKIKAAEARKENQLLKERKSEIEKQDAEKRSSLKNANAMIKEMERRKADLLRSKEEVEKEIKATSESNRKAYEKLSAMEQETARFSQESGRLEAQLNGIEKEVGNIMVNREQTEVRLADVEAELASYGTDAAIVDASAEEMEKEAAVLNSKVMELGTVNLKAPEVYEEKKRSVAEAESRADTLEIERQAVLRMIEEIDSKKLQVFMNTFNDVSKNFTKLYGYLFEGSAKMELTEPNDPFGSGLEIRITDSKSRKTLTSMSGGQKALISLMLLFAIHLCKPSAIYIFDEVDAALDKENSKELSKLIKQMSKDAQFVVVSHNDAMILNADTAVGVTMSNEASAVVGIEVSGLVKADK